MRRIFASVISVLLVGMFTICPTFAATSFPDVDENAAYAEAVEYVNGLGIMVGDRSGNFNPDKKVSRAEMATIICRMLGQTDNLISSQGFSDVAMTYWANPYITKAAELGIINGDGNGNFRPLDNVTYEQAITMVIRAIGGSTEAQQAGGYPGGFLAIADEYGFLDGVTGKKGDTLSRGDIAIIVYNCNGFTFSITESDI